MVRPRFRMRCSIPLIAVCVAACAPKEAPAPAAAAPAVDTAAVVAGVTSLWAKWVVADTAEDLAALLALATENARLDVKGAPPMIGREAAHAAMAPQYAQLNYLEASVTPTYSVAISNDLAHQAGTYLERYTMKGRKGVMTDYGRYAAAVVKEADGQWRWAYLMGMVDSTTTKK